MKITNDDLNDFFSEKAREYKEVSDLLSEIKSQLKKVKFLQTSQAGPARQQVRVMLRAAFDGQPNISAGKIEADVLKRFLEAEDKEDGTGASNVTEPKK